MSLPVSLTEEITAALSERGGGSRQAHRPSAQRDLGVYTPDLRQVVKTFKARIKALDGEVVHELALELLAQNITECRQVAYELLAGHRAARELVDRARLERLGQRLDNWACVDSFCGCLTGPAWRNGRLEDATVYAWAESDDLWWRRVAMVSTVTLNTKSKGGQGDAVRTLKVCAMRVADPEIMVQKAISWALRMLVSWDRRAVEDFLRQHEGSVTALVKREVQHKLATGKKH